MTGARRDRNIKIGSGKKKSTSSTDSTGWSRPAEGRREITPPKKAAPPQKSSPRRNNTNRQDNRSNRNQQNSPLMDE